MARGRTRAHNLAKISELRDAQGSNTGATPCQHRSNTVPVIREESQRRSAETPLRGLAPTQDAAQQHDPGDSHADPAEPVAVLVVEGRDALFAGGEQGDLGGQAAGAVDGA